MISLHTNTSVQQAVYITQLQKLLLQHVFGSEARHPTEQHEILDGIVAKPGGDYIHCVYRHRQVLPQSRQVFHGQKICFLGHNIISQNPGQIRVPGTWYYTIQ